MIRYVFGRNVIYASVRRTETYVREKRSSETVRIIETANKQKESMSLTDDRGYHGGAGHRSEPESK